MAYITIYHNGQCSKSNSALALLQQSGLPFNVRWYISDPLTRNELCLLLEKLRLPPSGLIRKGEPAYVENFADKTLSEDEYLQAMVNYPVLIERPIVALNDTAIIARPPEKITDFIK